VFLAKFKGSKGSKELEVFIADKEKLLEDFKLDEHFITELRSINRVETITILNDQKAYHAFTHYNNL
jgi:hypothetical protein